MGTAGVTPNTPAASPVSEKSTPSAESPDTADRIVREEAATEARRVEEGLCNFIFQEARSFLVKQFDEEYVKQNLGKLMHPQLQSHYGMLGPLVFLPDEVGNKFAKSFVYTEPWMTGTIQREAQRLQTGGISVAKIPESHFQSTK